MIDKIAIIGAGNGGKAAAADLALQGKDIHLFEYPEYGNNIEMLAKDPTLMVSGAVEGKAALGMVTTDLKEAVSGVDAIMVCTQALTHDRTAWELAPHVNPGQIVILNPGSTGGALHVARVFRQAGLKILPVLVEFSTLTYGCRADGNTVDIPVKVDRVLYGTFPASAAENIGPELETLYPGLLRAANVLDAGLNNANPVIHPPITLLNAARFENEGETMYFYRDGVSPAVAQLIKKLDHERMALLTALGYFAQSDPETCIQQGYAESNDYFECYKNGPGFVSFTSPNTLDHRYFHEDMGMGLVLYCALGELLDVPTPTSRAVVRMGSIISGIDYFSEGSRTLDSLGLDGLSVDELKAYLETGVYPGS